MDVRSLKSTLSDPATANRLVSVYRGYILRVRGFLCYEFCRARLVNSGIGVRLRKFFPRPLQLRNRIIYQSRVVRDFTTSYVRPGCGEYAAPDKGFYSVHAML